MKLTKNETRLINTLAIKGGWIKDSLEIDRNSSKEYDLLINGKNDLCDFSAWLPLSTISQANWPEYAMLSTYPEMVAEGDWSGIRDSDPDAIWNMFSEAIKELQS